MKKWIELPSVYEFLRQFTSDASIYGNMAEFNKFLGMVEMALTLREITPHESMLLIAEITYNRDMYREFLNTFK